MALPLGAQEEDKTVEEKLIQPAQVTDLEGQSPMAPKFGDSGRTMWAYILVLFVVIAGCYLMVRGKGLGLAKRLGGSSNIEILDTRALGNRQFLSVVRVYEQRILIGTGPQGVQMLSHLDKPSEPKVSGGEFGDLLTESTHQGEGESGK